MSRRQVIDTLCVIKIKVDILSPMVKIGRSPMVFYSGPKRDNNCVILYRYYYQAVTDLDFLVFLRLVEVVRVHYEGMIFQRRICVGIAPPSVNIRGHPWTF